jgi:hypothetical protein
LLELLLLQATRFTSFTQKVKTAQSNLETGMDFSLPFTPYA